jgi:hypothetical protein
MGTRAPQPDLNAFSESRYTSWRHWLSWAGKKLGMLPEALVATKAWNPGSAGAASFTWTTVEVPGARMGDPVSVGFTDDEEGVFYVGTVRRPGVVTVTLGNLNSGAYNMNPGTLTVIVWRAS